MYSHLFADWLFGDITPYYPFSTQYLQLNTFNSLEDIRVEIVLFLIAGVVTLLIIRPGNIISSAYSLTKIERINMAILGVPFVLITLLQLGYFILDIQQAGLTYSRAILGLEFPAILIVSMIISLFTFERTSRRKEPRFCQEKQV